MFCLPPPCVALAQSCVSPNKGAPFKIILLYQSSQLGCLYIIFTKTQYVLAAALNLQFHLPYPNSLLSFHLCKVPKLGCPSPPSCQFNSCQCLFFFYLKYCIFHLWKLSLGLFIFSMYVLNILTLVCTFLNYGIYLCQIFQCPCLRFILSIYFGIYFCWLIFLFIICCIFLILCMSGNF